MMNDTIFKAVTPEFPEGGGEGEVLLTFAEYGVPDREGDTFLPGSIPDGRIHLSTYFHGSSRPAGDLPIGYADIWSDENRAYAKAQFNLNTAAGRDTYEVIKASPDIYEFSFGFDPLKATPPRKGIFGSTNKGGRTYEKVAPFEISPLMKGKAAGRNTGVIAVKSQDIGLTEDETQVLKSLLAKVNGSSYFEPETAAPPEPEPEPEPAAEEYIPEIAELEALAYMLPKGGA